MIERRQITKTYGNLYRLLKPLKENPEVFNRHGKEYTLRGISTLINQEDLEEERKEKRRFDFSFEPPSIETEIRCYIREKIRRNHIVEKVRS